MALSKEYVGSRKYIDDCQAVLSDPEVSSLIREIESLTPITR